MTKYNDNIYGKFNLEIDVIERGKRKRHHHRMHNIVVNTGRQFLAETITASAFGVGSFTRTQDNVIRYIGFGLGGNRSSLGSPPYSVDYPGSNSQNDITVSVGALERPCRISGSPDVWMKQIATPGTFPNNYSTTFVAIFTNGDISYGPYSSVPLSEIGLYKSSADPALPNGGAGGYPGPSGHMVAYDTFNPIPKSGGSSIEVRWTWIFG